MLSRFTGFFLQVYRGSDYLTRRKAGLVLFFAVAVIVILNMATFLSLIVSVSRAKEFAISAVSASCFALLTMFFLRKGRLELASNIFVIFCSIVVLVGFYRKPPAEAYVTMVYFMFVTILFAAVFTNKIVTSVIMAAYVAVDVYFFMLHGGTEDRLVAGLVKTGLIDSLAALVLAYCIALFSTTVMQNAIAIIEDEKKKNDGQYRSMIDLHGIIRRSSATISKLAEGLSTSASGFLKNLQSQAHSTEVIHRSSMDAANSVTTVGGTMQEQFQALISLIETIRSMAVEIESLKVGSGDVAAEFSSVLRLTSKGEEAIRLIEKNSRSLVESSSRLSSVMAILEDLFDKIHLLALNAAIEAARAGDQGRGFAVVADEVGKLSEKSMTSLKEINQLISSNVQSASEGGQSIQVIVDLMRQIVETMNRLEIKSQDIFSHINRQEEIRMGLEFKIDDLQRRTKNMREDTGKQDTVIENIADSIANISILIQSNTEVGETISGTAERLAEMADALNRQVTAVGDEGAGIADN